MTEEDRNHHEFISEAISKKEAMNVLREIETGRGGIAELARKKPELSEISQSVLRERYGGVVSLFRVMSIPEGKDIRPETVVSLTKNWKVAYNMGRDQPGVIFARDKMISLDTVLLRYDVPTVPTERVLADVEILIRMSVEKLGGIDVLSGKGIRSRRSGDVIPIEEIVDVGTKEDEVIADVSELDPVALRFPTHVSGRKQMSMLHDIEAGAYDDPEGYLQHRISNRDRYEVITPDEYDEIRKDYERLGPKMKRFLNNGSKDFGEMLEEWNNSSEVE